LAEAFFLILVFVVNIEIADEGDEVRKFVEVVDERGDLRRVNKDRPPSQSLTERSPGSTDE
jgi:hypothetical protein